MKITISGSVGSGKSTVAKILASRLGLKHYSVGDFMRKLANERGIQLLELSRMAEKERWVDEALDRMNVDLGKNENNFILDSRLGFHFIPDSVRIFLDAELDVRARRILGDVTNKNLRKEEGEKQTFEEFVTAAKKREASERKRYMMYYNLDHFDRKNYDLFIDTSNDSPEQIADQIISWIDANKKDTKAG